MVGDGARKLVFGCCLLVASPFSFAQYTKDLDPVVVVPDPSPGTYSIGEEWYREEFDWQSIDYEFMENEGWPEPGTGKNASVKPDCGGNPVIRSTGNKIEPELDFSSQGEMGLYLQRTYNHYASHGGYFGDRWVSNFDYTLEYWGNSLVARRPDGRGIGFTRDGTSSRWNENKAQPVAYIIRNSDGSHTLYNEDGGVEQYHFLGYIMELKNKAGISWVFHRDGNQRLTQVTHSSGRSIHFVLDGYMVVRVIDPEGNVYRYSYTSAGTDDPYAGVYYARRLDKVILPGTPETAITYHYEGDGRDINRLVGKSYNGVRYSTFAYDGEERAIRTEHAEGVERYTFNYAVDSALNKLRVTETNPLGRQTVHHYHDGRKVKVDGLASPNCPAAAQNTAYDANGYPDVVTDFVGNAIDYDYSPHGHLLRKTEAVGKPEMRVTTYEWDEARNRPSKVTVAGKSETTFSYATHGRIALMSVRDLVTGQVRTTTYHYTHHSNGLLATRRVDAPLTANDVTMTYSSTGDLSTVTNANNQTTIYTNYNALGQPGRITSPSGAIVEYEYDARGRVVLQRTFPNGSPVQTRYVYGASGLLDAKTTSDGNTAYYHYDAARRLVQEDLTEPGGGHAVKRYTYDAMSNPIKIEIGRDH